MMMWPHEQPGEAVEQPGMRQEQQQGETDDDRRHDERRQEERDQTPPCPGKRARSMAKAVATPTASEIATEATASCRLVLESLQEIVVGEELLEPAQRKRRRRQRTEIGARESNAMTTVTTMGVSRNRTIRPIIARRHAMPQPVVEPAAAHDAHRLVDERDIA